MPSSLRALFLWMPCWIALTWGLGCDGDLPPEPEPEPDRSRPCMANIDPGEAVYRCEGDELLWCVCDQYVDNQCPDQKGSWVVQDILCTCEEWIAGNCPVE